MQVCKGEGKMESDGEDGESQMGRQGEISETQARRGRGGGRRAGELCDLGGGNPSS